LQKEEALTDTQWIDNTNSRNFYMFLDVSGKISVSSNIQDILKHHDVALPDGTNGSERSTCWFLCRGQPYGNVVRVFWTLNMEAAYTS